MDSGEGRLKTQNHKGRLKYFFRRPLWFCVLIRNVSQSFDSYVKQHFLTFKECRTSFPAAASVGGCIGCKQIGG